MLHYPKITIIVPIYNVEPYLSQCLDSILNQSLRNHKAILVNDGSTDRSGEIAEAYAKKYPEMFTYVYQTNHGLGAARNSGLINADTEYVVFLDSDDWLRPRTIEIVTRMLEDHTDSVDIGFMEPIIFDMASVHFSEFMDAELLEKIFCEQTDICAASTPEIHALEASICRCVIRRSFLKEVQFSFPTGVKWEDVFPHFYLLHQAKHCIHIPDAGFYYRTNSGTQITSTTSAGMLDIFPVFSHTYRHAVENKWCDEEIAYIIGMLQNFSRWFLDVAESSISRQLVSCLHRLYGAISYRHYRVYRKALCPSRKEILRFHLLKAPFAYRFLANHHYIDCAKWCWRKIKSVLR